MAKKKKRRIQAPSLSKLDKGIYYCLTACFFAAAIFLYPVIVGTFRRSVFENRHILAQNNTGIVIPVFFCMFLFLGFAVGIDWLRRKKQPIFGKSNVQYGPPQWKPIYPLLSKPFWKNLCSNKKSLTISVLCTMLLLAIMTAVTALGLPPRECLYDDGRILAYNCLNEETEKYSPSDVERILISTYRSGGRGSRPWGIEIKISMRDGKEFLFRDRDFQTLDDHIRGSLTGMHRIKSCFDPGIITCFGENNIPDVIRDKDLNEQEAEMLYLLFDMNAPTIPQ